VWKDRVFVIAELLHFLINSPNKWYLHKVGLGPSLKLSNTFISHFESFWCFQNRFLTFLKVFSKISMTNSKKFGCTFFNLHSNVLRCCWTKNLLSFWCFNKNLIWQESVFYYSLETCFKTGVFTSTAE
jgi:hypothetical protein